jgi:hypothetical protein
MHSSRDGRIRMRTLRAERWSWPFECRASRAEGCGLRRDWVGPHGRQAGQHGLSCVFSSLLVSSLILFHILNFTWTVYFTVQKRQRNVEFQVALRNAHVPFAMQGRKNTASLLDSVARRYETWADRRAAAVGDRQQRLAAESCSLRSHMCQPVSWCLPKFGGGFWNWCASYRLLSCSNEWIYEKNKSHSYSK